MDPSLRSNGSNTRLPTQPSVRTAVRSRLAGRVERVLNSALAGERAAVLNATSAELLADPVAVAAVFESALDRPGVGVLGHFMAHELLRRYGLHDDLLKPLASPHPPTRAAAARARAGGRGGGGPRVSPVLGIAHDRRWPLPVRLAACKALAMIGDPSAADGLHRLAEADPDQTVKKTADRAYRRLLRRAV